MILTSAVCNSKNLSKSGFFLHPIFGHTPYRIFFARWFCLAPRQMSSKATLKRSGLVGIGPRMAKLCHLAKTAAASPRKRLSVQGLIASKSFLMSESKIKRIFMYILTKYFFPHLYHPQVDIQIHNHYADVFLYISMSWLKILTWINSSCLFAINQGKII